jgi:protein-tyrosine phosphatase
MEGYLRNKMNATDDELIYLTKLTDVRTNKHNQQASDRTMTSSPSIVIDDFLYHGDIYQASNINLLNSLNIRHIIDVCDYALDPSITETFNVLWLNVHDDLQTDIRKLFDQSNAFLWQCRQLNEKVLVHCQMGISRSSSIVLAYLMK